MYVRIHVISSRTLTVLAGLRSNHPPIQIATSRSRSKIEREFRHDVGTVYLVIELPSSSRDPILKEKKGGPGGNAPRDNLVYTIIIKILAYFAY